ncbi:hypothetical protein F5Y06DRAFT_297733 [Hypoxylon sp. FL0890]|nr:hypothetical protein F5Y06DRAFT_297733 [Hypoxylon sp. FL0890]
MAELELPDFEVRTDEDAKTIKVTIDTLENYVVSIEQGATLSTATVHALNKITDWIPYALAELGEARDRFAYNSKMWNLIVEMKDTLRSVSSDVDRIFGKND